jgi:hypothetical protein
MEKSLADLLKENTANAFHKVLWHSIQINSKDENYKVNWKVVEKLQLNQKKLQRKRLELYD